MYMLVCGFVRDVNYNITETKNHLLKIPNKWILNIQELQKGIHEQLIISYAYKNNNDNIVIKIIIRVTQ